MDTVPAVRKAELQKCEVAGHIASAIREQEWKLVRDSFSSSFFPNQDPSPWGGAAHIQDVFPFQLNLSGNICIHNPARCAFPWWFQVQSR